MNYDSLSPKCKKAIGDFTEEESEDIHMDAILMKACTPMIKKFCDVSTLALVAGIRNYVVPVAVHLQE